MPKTAPLPEIKTIEHLIFYQYAKIIVRSALDTPDGMQAKKAGFGLIRNTLRALITGEKSWSDIMREDKQLVESEPACAYCGTTGDLQWEHIVPKSVRINGRCATCERILGIHNQLLACKTCNGASGKGTKGLYTFYRDRFPGNEKFYDFIPPLAEKKYLKTIYHCHVCNGTIHAGPEAFGGRLTAINIDACLTGA